jgi:hypothetical protein
VSGTRALANVISVPDIEASKLKDDKGKGKACDIGVSEERPRPRARPSARGSAQRDIERFALIFVLARWFPILIVYRFLLFFERSVASAEAQDNLRRSARQAAQDPSQSKLPFQPISTTSAGPPDEV